MSDKDLKSESTTPLTRERIGGIKDTRFFIKLSPHEIEALCDMALRCEQAEYVRALHAEAEIKLQAELEAVESARKRNCDAALKAESELQATRAELEEAQTELEHMRHVSTNLRDVNKALQSELSRVRQETIERSAQACIDMPQCDGSTYTYWPCVNAIRALRVSA